MKRVLFLIILLVSTINFAQIVGPKISYQEGVYDFGDLYEGLTDAKGPNRQNRR